MTAREQLQRDTERASGEEYARRAVEDGKKAAKLLFKAQWSYEAPEWYDHRLHFLDPEHHFTDFWTMSADNVIRVLPLGGRLLDLCSGDGFYAYYFFRLRAEVTCVERNKDAYEFARYHHYHSKIKYCLADVLEYSASESTYDVVVIRGAIEHFSEEDQQAIFRKAYAALKTGGYFCGDTPANAAPEKLLNSHEHEWANEAEMREALARVFDPAMTETWALDSLTSLHPNDTGVRQTLFWRCRK
jgi:SAM-dependent methyltransferase